MENAINSGITFKESFETEYSEGTDLADFISDDGKSLLLCGTEGVHINTISFPSDETAKLIRFHCPGQATAIGYDYFTDGQPFKLDWDTLGRNATTPPLGEVEFPSPSRNSEVVWIGNDEQVFALGDNHGPELINPSLDVRNSPKRFAYTLSIGSEEVSDRDWCKPYPSTYEGYEAGIEQEGLLTAAYCYHSYKFEFYFFWVGELQEIPFPYNFTLIVFFPWL
mmetsp:Transcript_9430/g.14457  ORF Transcript_9430/g.14457 Transcript_9430/m.14457 type:complete len:223 (-) Transcript_9430:179-847(-)